MLENGKISTSPFYQYSAIMRYAKVLGVGQLHFKVDPETDLCAIVAIHSTKLGPAIGGTRFYRYPSVDLAVIDALRLAHMMTLKAAVSDLPHGGAKAVLMKPKTFRDRQAYFRSYGDFVHQLNGRYITAVDMGTTDADMDIIAERTPYVFGASTLHAIEKDPSLFTARGVIRGIEAAVKFKLQRDNLDGIHVAVQGAGHVGYELVKMLSERGAKISLCDPKKEAVDRCVEKFKVQPVSAEKIYDVPCDIFAPCATGEILNRENINRLQASIVAGSANAQLAHQKFATLMHNKGILYVPDFVINSGGLIYAAMVYDYNDPSLADQKIQQIYHTLINIFERSQQSQLNTHDIAVQIAKERLNAE